MRHPIARTAAILLLLLSGCGGGHGDAANGRKTGSTAPIPAPGGDWTAIVTETPQGGFRMGNPNAPVKLVEYASLSCPFCAAFSKAAEPTIEADVRTGRLSWEYRTYMNHPTDPAVTVLVHCAGAQPFFAYARQLYATQDSWYARVANASAAELARISALGPTQRNAAIARLAGFDDFFRAHGMPKATYDACLADPAMLQKVLAITDLGNSDGINGTPNFLINGVLQQGVSSWGGLQPNLATALR